jgi:hypothetical protein
LSKLQTNEDEDALLKLGWGDAETTKTRTRCCLLSKTADARTDEVEYGAELGVGACRDARARLESTGEAYTLSRQGRPKAGGHAGTRITTEGRAAAHSEIAWPRNLTENGGGWDVGE